MAATGSEHSVPDDALDLDHGDEEVSYEMGRKERERGERNSGWANIIEARG